MGVDFLTCAVCKDNFPDCGDWRTCDVCEKNFCSSCMERWHIPTWSEVHAFKEEKSKNPDAKLLNECPFCTQEIIPIKDLLSFILEEHGLTQTQAEEAYRLAWSNRVGTPFPYS